MNDRGLYVVDGSALFARIMDLRKAQEEYKGLPLRVNQFSEAMLEMWSDNTGPVVRTIFYFKKHDERLSPKANLVYIPKSNEPDARSHWQINECAEAVEGIPEEELGKLSAEWRDVYHRKEKGLDMELACDCLQFVAQGKVSCVNFFVNDRDYIPLFKTLQRMGANTYLTGLSKDLKVNKDLANYADRYLAMDDYLDEIFGLDRSQTSLEIGKAKPAS